MEQRSQPLLFEISEPGLSWPSILIPDAMRAVDEDQGKLVLFVGHRNLFSLGHYLMTWRLLHGESVVLVDGANLVDIHLITRLAQGSQKDARSLLAQIHLSRAFTVHQLEAVIAERLEEVLRRYDSRLCLVSGLLDTFSDEEVRLWEAARLFRNIMRKLRRLADQGSRMIVLAPDPPVPAAKRKGLAALAVREADRVFVLSEAGGEFVLKDETKAARGRRWAFPSLPLSVKRPSRR